MTYDIQRLAHPRNRLIVHYNWLKGPFLQASPHGEQESRGEEEINKEPQDSMADLQDEQL